MEKKPEERRKKLETEFNAHRNSVYTTENSAPVMSDFLWFAGKMESLQSQNERLLSALKDEMSPRVAKLLLKIRDEITKWDASEAYHALYEIASPKFDKTEPWENIERIAKTENNE